MERSEYPQEICDAIEWFIQSEKAFIDAERAYSVEKSRAMLNHKDACYGVAECEAIIAIEHLTKEVDDLKIERERRGCWLTYLQRRPRP